ncbi:MAG: O-antigen ligase family protein [Planctomycetota bacterium]
MSDRPRFLPAQRSPADSPAAQPWAWLVTTLLLAVVLVGVHAVIDPDAYDVSQLPRLLAVMAGLLVAAPATLLVPALARRLDWRPLGDPLVVAAAAYLAACCLSLVVATNVSAGFTDVFRTLGGFLVLCLCLLVLPLDPGWRRRLLEMAVVATLAAVTVAAWELAPLMAAGTLGRRDLETAFLDGMMSNVNLFAGYLLLIVPWCLCAAAEFRGAWRGVAAATGLAAVATLAVLQSRADWLAGGAAAVGVAIVILRHRQALGVPAGLRRPLIAAVAFLPLVALVGGGLSLTDTPVGRAIDRLVISRPHQAGTPSDGGRTMVWGIAAEMIAEHPITGVGAGNFTLRMHDYFGSDRLGETLDFTNLSSDNWLQPHNDFLWVFAEKGLPGIVSFGAVFILAWLAVQRVLAGSPPTSDARLAVASLTALVAHLVFSAFDFPLDRVSHQLMVAVHLAVLVLLKRAAEPSPGEPVRLPGWLVLPPVVAATALGCVYAWSALTQEHAVLDTRRAQQAGDWEAMREAARRATTPWKTLDYLAVPVAFLEGEAERNLGNLEAATACFERAIAANPSRLYTLQNLGAAYAQGGRLDDAVDVFAIAADRYPARLELRHNLALTLVNAERFPEAIAVIEDVPEPLRTEGMREALAFARERVAAGPAAE